VTTGRFPVLKVPEAWDVWSMLALSVPGIEYRYQEEPGRRRTLWMLHPDRSWARATGVWDDPPQVHQGGPRRLWNELESIRRLNLEGGLPVYGARATITPDGETTLSRGDWHVTL
jgi:hypothetical protein